MSGEFRYHEPYAEPGAAIDPYLPRLRPGSSPCRIALFANLFTDSVAFLRDLSVPLARLLPGAHFQPYDKQFVRNMSVPASADLVERIATECDAALLAYGHCGSCTAGVVRDGITLARAGVPVVILVTRRFREEGAFLARALGMPDVPFVFLPHPVAGRSAEFHRALAQAVAPAVVSAMLNAASTDASDHGQTVAPGTAVA
jgi:hypothetical protein